MNNHKLEFRNVAPQEITEKLQPAISRYGAENISFTYDGNKLEIVIKSQSTRYREQIVEILDSQRDKGLEEYGQTLEDNNLSMNERIDHIAEELVDGLQYLLHVKERHNAVIDGLTDFVSKTITDGNAGVRECGQEINQLLKNLM